MAGSTTLFRSGIPTRSPATGPSPNLAIFGKGWARLDFAKAFIVSMEVVNDAAMQALGSYHGGRMLFLGLGTGLGSAMIINGAIEPMELAHLRYKRKKL